MVKNNTKKADNINDNAIYRKIGNKTIAYICAIISRIIFRTIEKFVNDDSRKNKEIKGNVDILQKVYKKPEIKTAISPLKDIDKKIDLSIIIPAYNAEKCIEQCLISIIQQNTKYNFEIIVINDGSNDRTLDIINNIKFTNLKIIDQNNKGFSGARNVGIENSVGKYIMFVDSDDYIIKDTIENLLDCAYKEDGDIIQGNYYSFYEEKNTNVIKNRTRFEKKIIDQNNNDEILAYPGYPWGKIYKRQLWENVRFSEGYWFEDTILKTIIFRECKKFIVIPEKVYAYRINPNGITATAKNNPKSLDTYWILDELLEQAERIGLVKDDVLFRILLKQYSIINYARLKNLGEDILKNVFLLSCDKIKQFKYSKEIKELPYELQIAYKSFYNRDYKKWRYLGKYYKFLV